MLDNLLYWLLLHKASKCYENHDLTKKHILHLILKGKGDCICVLFLDVKKLSTNNIFDTQMTNLAIAALVRDWLLCSSVLATFLGLKAN